MSRSSRLDDRPLICLVTDRRRLAAWIGTTPDAPATLDALEALAGQSAHAGVTMVQLREPDLPDEPLCQLAGRLAAVVAGHGARLLVNDRLDVALAAGAHGLHLKESSFPAGRVRGVVPDGFIIGRSVHDGETALAVAREGASDYVFFGPVYATGSKPGLVAVGPAALRAVARGVGTPVVAIGGVSEETAAEIAGTGAAGVAGIGLFIRAFASQSMQRVVSGLRGAFDSTEMVP